MGRSVLNTTLEFGLVSVPIAVMPTTSKQETALDRALPIFDMEAKVKEGEPRPVLDYHPVNEALVDNRDRTQFVDKNDLVKGIFTVKPKATVRDGWTDFKAIAPEALELIAEETKIESFEIEGFMPVEEIPLERAKGCYFIAPSGGAASARPLKLLYEALKRTERAGIVKIVIRERQHPAVIYAKNGGLFMNTLAWAEDFAQAKGAEEALAAVADPEEKVMAMAVALIESTPATRDELDALTDTFREKREELVAKALAGEEITLTPKAKGDGETDDLMEKLAMSVAGGKGKGTKKPAPKKASSTRAKAAAAA